MNNPMISALQTSGLRLTATRLAICNLLAETKEHPTAARIFADLKDQYPSLSLATVYNTLEMLVSLGMVHILGPAGDENTHYEPNTEPHVNLACIQCHTITDFSCEDAARLEEQVVSHSGYRVVGGRLLYYGVCPSCQAGG